MKIADKAIISGAMNAVRPKVAYPAALHANPADAAIMPPFNPTNALFCEGAARCRAIAFIRPVVMTIGNP